MLIAEIWEDELDEEWRGQFRDTDTGKTLGREWSARSRGELIGKMSTGIPLSHLHFRDCTNPLDH
jgi:hypothetical protein